MNNKNHYLPLSESIQDITKIKIRRVLEKLLNDKYITLNQFTYLLGSGEPKNRLFYLLSKIHKDPSKWTMPFKVPPDRPIVSDCGLESYRVAEYIDSFINPLSQKHESYIKDTCNFVHKLRSVQVGPAVFLFSIDITALYTNIDTKLGLLAVKIAFQENTGLTRPDSAILNLLIE